MGAVSETPGDGFVVRGSREDRLLIWKDVKTFTGLSRTTVWRMQKAGDFPEPVRISPGKVGWWLSDPEKWKASRAPRPLTEPRPFVTPPKRPAPVTSPSPPPVHEEAPVPAIEGRGAQAPRTRRSRQGSPDQIVFDFGL